jgi:hypothetical protein
VISHFYRFLCTPPQKIHTSKVQTDRWCLADLPLPPTSTPHPPPTTSSARKSIRRTYSCPPAFSLAPYVVVLAAAAVVNIGEPFNQSKRQYSVIVGSLSNCSLPTLTDQGTHSFLADPTMDLELMHSLPLLLMRGGVGVGGSVWPLFIMVVAVGSVRGLLVYQTSH